MASHLGGVFARHGRTGQALSGARTLHRGAPACAMARTFRHCARGRSVSTIGDPTQRCSVRPRSYTQTPQTRRELRAWVTTRVCAAAAAQERRARTTSSLSTAQQPCLAHGRNVAPAPPKLQTTRPGAGGRTTRPRRASKAQVSQPGGQHKCGRTTAQSWPETPKRRRRTPPPHAAQRGATDGRPGRVLAGRE